MSKVSTQTKISIVDNVDSHTPPKNSIQTISGRQSKDLVIAFCGAIGAGIKTTKKASKNELEELGYRVIDLRLSNLMDQFIDKDPSLLDTAGLVDDDQAFNRYVKYQNLGDKLREKFTGQIMAEAAINEISLKREQELQKLIKDEKSREEATRQVESIKTAYLIDQLKHPAEVELFRLIYQNNFYLIGVIRSEEERKRNLRDEGINKENIDSLIHRDRKAEEKHGQQTEKTILDSDIFIRNCQSHVAMLKFSIKRFLNLIHGVNGITPTVHEKGMFAAFSASLQSACLSRQVGAAIMDNEGSIISTGRNDVPKPFGGLYNTEDEKQDYRCFHKGGKCYNDYHKNKIKDKIESLLASENVPNSKVVAEKLYKKAGISSLLEFSRSIHAEMDAITSIARNGNSETQGTTLYTTTYPCHNCARHIVAAGISKAIYIEPYEKSLALDLHDDAITDQSDSEKVRFEPFEGVSPRRYPKFFFSMADRKSPHGEAVKLTSKYNHHVDIQFLDSYSTFESKILNDFQSKLSSLEKVEPNN
ncbi:Deoxycytidylate deaminase [Pseudoalteromonas sp. DSM 26666]|uniref:anti-phage dCTP deaminase n=1 Tax=Pseudoalteromonas sp. DSM 26666 TaxID=1761892 RepID=UPI0008F09885|nr:anti-phage dCTP deaminase [Pseudoalteromonas sp. DSM 26666]SFT69451.1 Deoxycytidylate deaminase [Pseudoalteromonas sp. DSM 26666]